MGTELKAVDTKTPLSIFAEKFGGDPKELENTLKQTCFKQGGNGDITNAQMQALMIVANQYGLNPFTKEIYAYPDKGAIVPVIGVDGWAKIINSHPQYDGIEFIASDDMVRMSENSKPCPSAMTCRIYRKDTSRPIEVTEYLDEVFRETKYPGPWQTHTKRMFRHKAMIQCARLAFGFSGVYDKDEAERIVEKDITPVKVEENKTSTLHSLLSKKPETVSSEAVEVSARESNNQNEEVDTSTGEIKEPPPIFFDLIKDIQNAQDTNILKQAFARSWNWAKKDEYSIYQNRLKEKYDEILKELESK